MSAKRRVFPKEFRREMVELVRSGRTAEELSKEFEPSAQAIRNWVKQAERDAGRRSDGATSAEREELRRLRRENRRLREERGDTEKSRGLVRSGDRVEIFRFVKANQARFRVATMCRVLGVSTSGYYAWRGRQPSARELSDAGLVQRIRAIHRESRGTYGAPRIHFELAQQGIRVSRKRVARLMKEAGLEGVHRRRPVRTTTRNPESRPAPDLVEREFSVTGPDRLWVADIERHEALLNLAVVKGHCLWHVAACQKKLRAARTGERR